MSRKTFSVPPENGGTLFLPPLAEYGGVVEKNRALPKNTTVAGKPLTELAVEARRKTLSDALDYTSSLGLSPGPSPDPEKPIIAAGHQPIMFHPGVAIKTMALLKTARENSTNVIFFSVDSDEFKEKSVSVPQLTEEGLRKSELEFYPYVRGGIYEASKGWREDELIGKLKKIREGLSGPGLAAPAEALADYIQRLQPPTGAAGDYTSQAIKARRVWEATVCDGFLELPVSRLCGSGPFLSFASDIIQRLDQFREIYNSELWRYRKERKLRYPANPFPDLEYNNGLLETPFWTLTDGGREKLFAHNSDGEITVSGETMPRRPLDDLLEGKISVRPRAITLSMYLRLFVCDLFIHGVGGSKYDTITDLIIERFYGIEPPEYACVSATLWLDVNVEDPRARMEELNKSLRDTKQHPEKAAGEDAKKIAPLAEEKARLVAEIKKPGADKKTIGAGISELNRRMSEALAPAKAKLEQEIESLSALEKRRQAAAFRGYPFFLYRPERIFSLLD